MNYLLDTHILLWARLSPGKLPANHRAIITGSEDLKFISPLSIWEISLKYARGKLNLAGHSPEEFLEGALRLGFRIMATTPEQFASFHSLPPLTGHKDPFDRMLIWQAIQSDVTLLSRDSQLPEYNIHGLKLA